MVQTLSFSSPFLLQRFTALLLIIECMRWISQGHFLLSDSQSQIRRPSLTLRLSKTRSLNLSPQQSPLPHPLLGEHIYTKWEAALLLIKRRCFAPMDSYNGLRTRTDSFSADNFDQSTFDSIVFLSIQTLSLVLDRIVMLFLCEVWWIVIFCSRLKQFVPSLSIESLTP